MGPPASEDSRLVHALAQHFVRDHVGIRLTPVIEEGAAAAAHAIDANEADLAIVRRDVAYPQAGQAIAELRESFVAIIVPAPGSRATRPTKEVRNKSAAKAKTSKPIEKIEDFEGRRIGVVPGSTNAQAIRNQLERRKLAATLVEFRDRDEGVAALTRGDIDGFATDKVVLLAMAQTLNPRDFTMLPEDLSFEPFAIMLPRGDWAFRLAVNTALAQIFRSGDVLDLYSKYFSGFAARPSLFLGAVFTFGALPE